MGINELGCPTTPIDLPRLLRLVFLVYRGYWHQIRGLISIQLTHHRRQLVIEFCHVFNKSLSSDCSAHIWPHFFCGKHWWDKAIMMCCWTWSLVVYIRLDKIFLVGGEGAYFSGSDFWENPICMSGSTFRKIQTRFWNERPRSWTSLTDLS